MQATTQELSPFQRAVAEVKAHEISRGLPEHLAERFAYDTLFSTCNHLRRAEPVELFDDLVRLALTDDGLTEATARALVADCRPDLVH